MSASTDTNPEFWYCWEQLGQAVAVRAVYDYVSLQKKINKLRVAEDKDYNCMRDADFFEQFFRSKYFAYICPKYDGWELYDKLQSCWNHLPKVHNYAKHATYVVGDWGKYTGRPVGKRGTKPSRFGIKREGENGL